VPLRTVLEAAGVRPNAREVLFAGADGGPNPEAGGATMAFERSLPVERAMHPDTLLARKNVGSVLASLGHYTEAIALNRELLPLERKIVGPQARTTLNTLQDLADELAQIGDFREAEATLREAIRLSEQ
jgi:tetratricopeptide (TPR) repeat protein